VLSEIQPLATNTAERKDSMQCTEDSKRVASDSLNLNKPVILGRVPHDKGNESCVMPCEEQRLGNCDRDSQTAQFVDAAQQTGISRAPSVSDRLRNPGYFSRSALRKDTIGFNKPGTPKWLKNSHQRDENRLRQIYNRQRAQRDKWRREDARHKSNWKIAISAGNAHVSVKNRTTVSFRQKMCASETKGHKRWGTPVDWCYYRGAFSLHSAKTHRMRRLERLDEKTRKRTYEAELFALERSRSRAFDQLMEQIRARSTNETDDCTDCTFALQKM